jgi:hypothetical protein
MRREKEKKRNNQKNHPSPGGPLSQRNTDSRQWSIGDFYFQAPANIHHLPNFLFPALVLNFVLDFYVVLKENKIPS